MDQHVELEISVCYHVSYHYIKDTLHPCCPYCWTDCDSFRLTMYTYLEPIAQFLETLIIDLVNQRNDKRIKYDIPI